MGAVASQCAPDFDWGKMQPADLEVVALHQIPITALRAAAPDMAPALPLECVPSDVLLALLSLLDAKSLCAGRAVSKPLLLAERSHAQPLWRTLCFRDFGGCTDVQELQQNDCGSSSSWDGHATYLRQVLRFATQELAHLQATAHVRGPLAAYAEVSGGVVGLVGDLAHLQDEKVAVAVSHRRRIALDTAIVTSHTVVANFRRRSGHHGLTSFLPLDTIVLDGAAAGDRLAAEEMRVARRPPLGPEVRGFIGYVVDMFKLPLDQEFLRETVLHTLFRDMTVFETTQDAEAYRQSTGAPKLFFCSLDWESDAAAKSAPYISHWGQRPPLDCAKEARLSALALNARSSLAYVIYGS